MKKYNRALDYTVLALSQLTKGKPVLAARLLASAAKEGDVHEAIAVLEASNSHAFKMTSALAAKAKAAAVQATQAKPAPTQALASKKRLLTAADEFPFDDGEEVEADEVDLDSDPLDDVEDEDDGEVLPEEDEEEAEAVEEEAVEEDSAATMAKVLAKMTRKVSK